MIQMKQYMTIIGLVAMTGLPAALAQGPLDPTNTPAPTMRTLDQIYNAISASAPVAAAGTGGLVTLPPTSYPLLPFGATDAALYLELDGDDILGDNPNSNLGREGSIYVLAYGGSVSRPVEGGPLTVSPICILKPIDRSSPLLVRGVILNQSAQGEIRFFRLNTMGNGTTEHFYSVIFSNGRIIRHEQVMPGYELVVFTFGNGVPMSLRAAREIEAALGWTVRVVDLRWLQPLNADAIARHAGDCARILVVDEGRRSAGVGEGVITAVMEAGHGAKPLRRVVGEDTYTPLAGAAFLVIPSDDDIVAMASELA